MMQTMLTLSGAPDRGVSWSDFLLLHKTVTKLSRIFRTIFSSFTGFVISNTCWSSVDVEL